MYRDTDGTARGVAISGNYAYIADGVSGLAVIDISNPASPGAPVYRDTDDEAYGVAIDGGYAFLANENPGLAIISLGSIKNGGGNNATLTLPALGGGGSLAASSLKIDTTVPTVNGVTSTALNGTYKQGQMIAITIEFSEVVNVTGTPQLTLETGGSDAVVDYLSLIHI